MTIPREQIRRILCIKPRGIGDIILSTIVLDNIAAAYPDATIDYLTEGFGADAVRDIPLVRHVLTFEKKESLLAVVRRIRRERYDLVIDLWTNPRSAQMTFLSGAPYRVGYAYRFRSYAYNILGTGGRGSHHAAEHNLELLKPLGIPVVSRRLHFATRPEDDSTAGEWISRRFGEHPVVAILPAGGWASKRCPPATWIAICQGLADRYNPAFLVLWGPGDEAEAAEIRRGVTGNLELAPPTSIRLLASFLKRCALAIANDSGPMHVAAAVGTPTIGLFGPTDPRGHQPYGPNCGGVSKTGLHCLACNKLVCPYGQECMTQLPIDDLLEMAERCAGERLRGSSVGVRQ